MKGISRRTRACAAVAGLAVLASAASAQAQTRPEKVGDGIPTGQMSVQMFNYGGFISNGANNTVPTVTGIKPAADGTQCNTNVLPTGNPPVGGDPAPLILECRWNRVEALFAFLQKKGLTSIEAFGHQAFPTVNATTVDVAGLQRYRALLDKYGLHVAGQHGNLSATVDQAWRNRVQAAKILGMDAIGSGGYGSPGISNTGGQQNGYANTLQTAKNLNTIGKYSVEQGVGPVYVHNHTAEFDNKYVHNGELKSAVEIIAEETDPRYVFLEIDVFWSSDAFDDETGQQTAALINKYPTRIKQLHIKDGTGVTGRASATDSRNGQPQATGTGVVDFRPIFAAAKNRVQYYHQEHDGGTMAHADTSFTNLKGINSASVPALLGYPGQAAVGPANGTRSFKVNVSNTGDKPLAITTASITGDNAADFSIANNGCANQTLAAGVLATESAPAVARGACEVTVNYKATANLKSSVAYLQFASNADDATEKVLLTGSTDSNYVVDAPVGGTVAPTLALTLGAPVNFGPFTPGVARNYDQSATASVLSTAGDATLSVSDADPVNTGKLVNGAFALAQPLQISANNAANSTIAYKAVGASTPLLTYAGPTPGTDAVTLNFRQSIGANDPLRTGSYAKTLTFTVATTTP